MKTIEVRPTLQQEQGVFDVVEIDSDGFGYTLATFFGPHAERNAAIFSTAVRSPVWKLEQRNIRRKK